MEIICILLGTSSYTPVWPAVVTRKEQLYMGIHHLTKLWAEAFTVIFMLFVCLLRKVDPQGLTYCGV